MIEYIYRAKFFISRKLREMFAKLVGLSKRDKRTLAMFAAVMASLVCAAYFLVG